MDSFLENEISRFKEIIKFPKNLSLDCKKDYDVALKRAFNDAFNQYARRKKISYKRKVDNITETFVSLFYDFFRGKNQNEDFNTFFKSAINTAMSIFKSNKFGLAQKFVTMAFKYFFCYLDAQKYSEKFCFCYMPIDKFTLIWIKSLGNEEINRKLSGIKYAWTKIDYDLFIKIQEYVKNVLSEKHEYIISYNSSSKNNCIILPQSPFKSEFIIWHQEHINEIRKTLNKNILDFDRIGIKDLYEID